MFCERGDEILAVLPLAHLKSLLFGNVLISMPFLVYGGVVSIDSVAEQLLVDAACQKAVELRVDRLELRNQVPSGRDWPSNQLYATFSKRIHAEPEKNLLEVPRKQRAMIRKGIQAGLKADSDENTDRLYKALLDCKRNLGTPFFRQSFLQKIFETFGNSVEITTVSKDNETVCSVMSFKYRNTILPYYGGGGEFARSTKGNDFMYWAVMEKACQEGIEIFDYGRSMIGSGAYLFKKHWGFEPKPLAYEYFPVSSRAQPNLNPANRKFQLAIRLWKRLPLGVAEIIGPPIARRIG
jgi:FemAB-related protein (PEP-CTERM system-associated)